MGNQLRRLKRRKDQCKGWMGWLGLRSYDPICRICFTPVRVFLIEHTRVNLALREIHIQNLTSPIHTTSSGILFFLPQIPANFGSKIRRPRPSHLRKVLLNPERIRTVSSRSQLFIYILCSFLYSLALSRPFQC